MATQYYNTVDINHGPMVYTTQRIYVISVLGLGHAPLWHAMRPTISFNTIIKRFDRQTTRLVVAVAAAALERSS